MKILSLNLSILFAALFFVACEKSEKQIEDTSTENLIVETANNTIQLTKDQFNGENMKLEKIKEISFPSFIRTTGTIDVPPKSRAIINSFIGGYIKKSPLLIGDKVQKGQALVTIENLEFIEMQQEYIEIAEQLKYLKSDYERQKELFSEKITSEKSFLRAESDYKKANVMHKALKKKLSLLNFNITSIENGNLTSITTVYAPISGSITDVNVSIGSFVSPSDKIMEIVNTDHIHLELKVFEKDILNVKEGQKVIFRMPESLSKSFVGVVHLIGKSIDKNRMVQVHVHIENEYKHNFIVGMFVESDIVINDTSAMSLPEDAITDSNGKSYILVLTNQDTNKYRFIKREVKIGQTFNGYSEIIDGAKFKKSDKFLLGGFNLINEEE